MSVNSGQAHTVGPVAARVIKVGTEDAGAEVVGNEPPGSTVEEGEAGGVPLQKCPAVFTQGRVEKLVTAVAQGIAGG
jgi:hypothetical protein